jgi:hypothetical protein
MDALGCSVSFRQLRTSRQHSGSDYAGPSRAPHAVADCGRLTRCSAFPWSDDDRTAACRPASSPSSQTNGDLRASGDARRLPRHVPRYRYRDEFAALTAPSSIAAARESGAVQHFRLVAVSGINRNRAAPLGEQGSPARSVKPSGERERAARSGFRGVARHGVVSSPPTPDDSRLITPETAPPSIPTNPAMAPAD